MRVLSDGVTASIEHFAPATLDAAELAHAYVGAVNALQDR